MAASASSDERGGVMHTVLRHCTTCGGEREFETPPCVDGHGLDCPELACIACGSALLVGSGLVAGWLGEASPVRTGTPAARPSTVSTAA
jgi:hypothetical protein